MDSFRPSCLAIVYCFDKKHKANQQALYYENREMLSIFEEKRIIRIEMLEINNDLLEQCDQISKVYCNSFNKLNSLLDLNYSDYATLSDMDLSALGLYICKCVEQEINSSVVQLIRKHLGVIMPEYYCKVDPSAKGARVDTGHGISHHYVWFNNYVDNQHKDILKIIPLGDAYWALEQLLEEGADFSDYPVLYDIKFCEIWRQISTLRNEIAHCGSVINRERIVHCLNYGLSFLKDYQPKLARIKSSLVPNGWRNHGAEASQSGIKEPSRERSDLIELVNSHFNSSGKPKAKPENYNHWKTLQKLAKEYGDSGKLDQEKDVLNKMVEYEKQFDWFDTPFQQGNYVGLKDIMGKVVIPARYNSFNELHSILYPTTNVSAVFKEDKCGLVERYTGKEITEFCFDSLQQVQFTYNFYFFKQCGSLCYGMIDSKGQQIIPCIIDSSSLGTRGLYITSGGKNGYYSYDYNFLVQPIYDEIITELDEPSIFIMDGVEGYYHKSGKFLTKEYLERMEKDDSLEYYEYTDLLGEWQDL